MKRREFIALLAGAAAGPSLRMPAASAQSAGKIARVGLLFNGLKTPLTAAGYPVFVDELRQQGFVEGRNLVIEQRVLGQQSGDPAPFYADAADLVRSKVDVLAAFGSEVFIQAAVAASKTIPIVMLAINYDPIERGYVKSLARPGGNITGVTFRQPELAGKQIELLREAFPGHARLAAFYDAESAEQFSAAETAAKSMQLQIVPVKLANPPYDFALAFKAAVDDRAQTVLVLSSGYFTAHRAQIAELAIQHRLPTMFIFKTYVEVGGLMSYGVDFLPAFRRVGEYVAKILKGAKAADLPVEQVTTFELAVNLKTAKAIGVELPTSILLRANTVIE